MYFFYRIITNITVLLSPIIIFFRILKGKEDPKRIGEKFCIYSQKKNNKRIWIHAASVGELMSVVPIIKKFEKNKKIINCSSGNIKNILKEIYKRLVIPFYIPLLILISLLLLLYSKENSKYKKIKFLTFFLGLIIIIFSETTIRFVNSNLYFNLTLIIIPFILIFIFYCFFIFNVNTFSKKRS